MCDSDFSRTGGIIILKGLKRKDSIIRELKRALPEKFDDPEIQDVSHIPKVSYHIVL